jgi:hypothetical protein
LVREAVGLHPQLAGWRYTDIPREPEANSLQSVYYIVDMLIMTWEFKLEPTREQVLEIERTLEVCRHVWNYALRERKDWLDSRKSPVNACSIRSVVRLNPEILQRGK